MDPHAHCPTEKVSCGEWPYTPQTHHSLGSLIGVQWVGPAGTPYSWSEPGRMKHNHMEMAGSTLSSASNPQVPGLRKERDVKVGQPVGLGFF